MTKGELIFFRSAKKAAGRWDGNFQFTCPHCGGYSIGVRKSNFGIILASCGTCSIFIKAEIQMKKGA